MTNQSIHRTLVPRAADFCVSQIFGLVTNMDCAGEDLIHWQWARCWKSEKAHSIMKWDFAAGHDLKVMICIQQLPGSSIS